MVSKDLIKQKMELYIRLVDAGDIEGILALYADDAVVEDPVGTEPYSGIDAIARFYRGGLGQVNVSAEQTGTVRTTAAGEGAIPFRVTIQNDDQTMVIEPVDFMRFNEVGKIVSMRAFWSPEHNYTSYTSYTSAIQEDAMEDVV